MRTALSILGSLCFVAGFALATGVDQNPVQAVYCVALMGCALVCFKAAERKQAAENKTLKATINPRKWEDAA